jgi:hypothetical protein
MLEVGFIALGKVFFDIWREIEGGLLPAGRGRGGGGDSRLLAPS